MSFPDMLLAGVGVVIVAHAIIKPKQFICMAVVLVLCSFVAYAIINAESIMGFLAMVARGAIKATLIVALGAVCAASAKNQVANEWAYYRHLERLGNRITPANAWLVLFGAKVVNPPNVPNIYTFWMGVWSFVSAAIFVII